MSNKLNLIILLLFIISVSIGCNEKLTEKAFLSKIKTEKESNLRNDTLFLGYRLGMLQTDFYKLSWELNKQKVIREGLGNTSISYSPEGFSSPISMYFYPGFKNEKISNMSIKFNFNGWNPIIKDHWSDKLILEVKEYFEKIWKIKFYYIKSEQYGLTYQAVKNNKYIRLRLQSELIVFVDIFDTTVYQDTY
jgi:hypothetical protein